MTEKEDSCDRIARIIAALISASLIALVTHMAVPEEWRFAALIFTIAYWAML